MSVSNSAIAHQLNDPVKTMPQRFNPAVTGRLKRPMKQLLIAALLLPSATMPSFAHSGGLNAQGCHNNRKTGDYHCHRGASPPVNVYAPVREVPQPNRSAEGSAVKMSRSGICHAPGSSYYAQTMNFTPYSSLDACLSAGGRLPKR